MKAQQKIEALIETRINGNSIKGNTTYENMLKSLRTSDFTDYDMNFEGHPTMYVYRKIDKIEVYVNLLTHREA
jgi:hypothetical protein